MGTTPQDQKVLDSTKEKRIMENGCIEIDRQGLADWEKTAARLTSDPANSPAIKRALVDALEMDPVDAVRDAETVYQILLQRALSQSNGKWKWRSQPTWCWVCDSRNTRLVRAPGYGIVYECLDCRDKLSLDGAVQWVV